jgi:hypothetical protein
MPRRLIDGNLEDIIDLEDTIEIDSTVAEEAFDKNDMPQQEQEQVEEPVDEFDFEDEEL